MPHNSRTIKSQRLEATIGVLALVLLCSGPAAADERVVTFQNDVLPILKSRCAKCHSRKTRKADLSLHDFAGVHKGGESGPVIQPGEPGESLLFEMIHSGTMPPQDEPQVTKKQIEIIRRWIESGAHSGSKQIAEDQVDYLDIVPLLLRRCVMCHGPEYQLGGFDARDYALITKGGASGPGLIAGRPQDSLMVQRVAGQLCPPKADIGESGIEPMTPAELTQLKKWISAGARPQPMVEDVATRQPDPLVTDAERQFWSFVPPGKTAAPTGVRDETNNEIDAFILFRLREAGLPFSPAADRITLVRRASLALTGLPPDESLLNDFLQDETPRAWPRFIDRLLDSPHYGEKWGRFWLDLAGYSDSEGKRNADSVRPFAWKYRDWVIKAFNQDKSYNEFLVEQIAGDELVDWADPASVTNDVVAKLTATGFLRMVPDGTAADPVNRFSDRLEVISDTIDVVSRGVIGLTMNCARCHTHKYDPIPQRDYYRMVAIFKGAYDEYDWLTPHKFNNQWKKSKQRLLDVLTPENRVVVEQQSQSIRQDIAAVAAKLKSKGLAKDEKKKLTQRQTTLTAQLNQLPQIRALWDRGRPSPTFVYRRGENSQPGTLVGPGVPSVLTDGRTPFVPVALNHSSPKTGRRLAFARWLTQDEHPLTARVFVNRIWQQHFGRGIVESVDNFGKLGTPPSHPELLDWLAVDFVEHGWSIKRLHRQIMTSAVWMQSSAVNEQHQKIDPDNQLWSRMPMRRLSAEEVRDTMLVLADRLNTTPFGEPDAVEVRADGLVTSQPVGGKWRRSIYVRQRRTQMPTLFDAFDLPQMTPNCTRRNASTVVTQPLILMNNRLVYDLAQAFAERVRQEAGDDETQQLSRAFTIALNRPPSQEESDGLVYALHRIEQELNASASVGSESDPESKRVSDIKTTALAGVCHGLINSASMLYVD